MSQAKSSPLLLLPKELRLAIYRHVFVNPSGHVQIIDRECEIDHESVQRYVCKKDLRILGTSHQIRDEANEVFYRECIFTIYLTYTDRNLGPLRQPHDHFMINISRVRNCHILSPPSICPRSLYDSKEESAIESHFRAFAKTLGSSRGHHLQYLLVGSYHFEIATVEGGARLSLRFVVEDLESVHGIGCVHIRSLNNDAKHYLLSLEESMMYQPLTDLEAKKSRGHYCRQESRIASCPILQTELSKSDRAPEVWQNRDARAKHTLRRFGVSPLVNEENIRYLLSKIS